MNLIFVYGPPAVGKYTVALELSKISGYRLFHNHLTVPPINAIFGREDRSPARDELRKRLRLVSIAAAASAGINLIFTAAYSGGPDDEAFIQAIADIVKATPGGKMMYVQLHAPKDVLLQRVREPSRKKMNVDKMTDPNLYRQRLETERDITVSVPYPGVLHVDTTKYKPEGAARLIKRHFGL